MKRRDFLKASAGAGVTAFFYLSGLGCKVRTEEARLVLPSLPYPSDGLEPFISKRTIQFHYGKHHRGYVTKTRQAIAGTDYQTMTLSEIVGRTGGQAKRTSLFNTAAQAFNHEFYWKSLKPGGGGKPEGTFYDSLRDAFGGYSAFRQAFLKKAMEQFASGWVWLVQHGGKMKIMTTANADTPMTQGAVPLLTVDLWEHAYYLDYQNRRVDYVEACLDHLLNWDFAAENLACCTLAEEGKREVHPSPL